MINKGKMYHVYTVGESTDDMNKSVNEVAEEVDALVNSEEFDPKLFAHKAYILSLGQGIIMTSALVSLLRELSDPDRIMMISECGAEEPHGQAYVKGEDIEDRDGVLYVNGPDAIVRPPEATAPGLKILSDDDIAKLMGAVGVDSDERLN